MSDDDLIDALHSRVVRSEQQIKRLETAFGVVRVKSLAVNALDFKPSGVVCRDVTLLAWIDGTVEPCREHGAHVEHVYLAGGRPS